MKIYFNFLMKKTRFVFFIMACFYASSATAHKELNISWIETTQPPSLYYENDELALQVEVFNAWTTASDPYEIVIFLWDKPTWPESLSDPGILVAGRFQMDSAQFGYTIYSFNITIPEGMKSGNYRAGAYIQDGEDYLNSGMRVEQNQFEIIGQGDLFPDIAVQAVTCSGPGGGYAVAVGETLTTTVTIKNTGGGEASSYTLEMRLSPGASVPDLSIGPLAVQVVSQPLPAGATVAHTLTGIVPSGLPPGLYYAGVKVIATDDSDPSNDWAVDSRRIRIKTDEEPEPVATTVLEGRVTGLSETGDVLGPVEGATVSIAGGGSLVTGSDGTYRFLIEHPGERIVRIDADGYFGTSRSIIVDSGVTHRENFALTVEAAQDGPRGYNFLSPAGQHFIAGLPVNLDLQIEVEWRGDPGEVRYRVAGQWQDAEIQDLGGGRALARLSLPLPGLIEQQSRLRIEISNGQGETTVLENPGVHFYPYPEILSYFDHGVSWDARLKIEHDYKKELWAMKLGSHFSSSASFGVGAFIEMRPFAGSIQAELSGFGFMKADLAVDGVDLMGEGKISLAGGTTVLLLGEDGISQTPYWTVGISGKTGVGAPAVRVIEAVFPPAASVITPMMRVPVLSDVLKAVKFRLFKTGALTLHGEYEDFQTGDGWLGTTGMRITGTVGIEGQAVLDAGKSNEAGLYVGGEASPTFSVHPDLAFKQLVLRAYMGAFYSVWIWEYKQEIGMELVFNPAGEVMAQQTGMVVFSDATGYSGEMERQPIGHRLRQWGEANRLPEISTPLMTPMSDDPIDTSIKEDIVLLENVLRLATPDLTVRGEEAHVILSVYDADRPQYMSTDIGQISRLLSGGGWSFERLTDIAAADLMPSQGRGFVEESFAAWIRITGDLSDPEEFEDIASMLNLMVSRLDPATGEWEEATQVTDTDVVTRNPMPIRFGQTTGVLWVENEGLSMVGNGLEGDALLFSTWDGMAWSTPQTLWSDQKGLLDYDFIADGEGNGHIVFVVDEDPDLSEEGDREERTRQELYWIYSEGGIWQDGVRLTDDEIRDGNPVMTAPDGDPLLVWDRGSVLHYSRLLDWNPREVYSAATLAGEAPSLAGVTMPSGAVIAYTSPFEEGIDLVAAFYDACLDRWSLPIRLTNDVHGETAISMAWDHITNRLLIAYLKTATDRADVLVEFEDGGHEIIANAPVPGRTDLHLLSYPLGTDIGVAPNSLRTEPANPAPGEQAQIHVEVQNLGELSAAPHIRFYNGDPEEGGSVIAETQILTEDLLPGGSVEVSVLWTIPPSFRAGRIFVVVDPMLQLDDRDRSNNTAWIRTVLPDPVIAGAMSEQISPTQVELMATVGNEGVIEPEAEMLVEWRVDQPDGEIIATAFCSPMLPGTTRTVAAVWNSGQAEERDQFHTVYVRVIPMQDEDDLDPSNNQMAQAVRLPYGPAADWMSLSPETRIHSAWDDGTHKIRVFTTGEWEATTEQDWITIAPESAVGQGQGIVRYTLFENSGPGDRSGDIVITAQGNDSAVFEVRQAGTSQTILTYYAAAGGSLEGSAVQITGGGVEATPVTARPDPGAAFSGWDDGIDSATRTDSGSASDLTVTAYFQTDGGVAIDWYATHDLAPRAGQNWSDLDVQRMENKPGTLREEYIAGTNPWNPSDVFRIIEVDAGAELLIRWQGKAGRRYRVMTTDDLSGTWSLASSGAGESSPDRTLSEDAEQTYRKAASGDEGVRFYRLTVEKED